MENPRYRTRQLKYIRKRKYVRVGPGFFNDFIQENLTIVNEKPDDENTHFVNDMCWRDGNDSADHDDSD